jgi:hypothetical protein
MKMSSASRKGTMVVSVRQRVLLLLALATGLTGFWSSGSGTPTAAQSTGSTPVAEQSQPSFEESSPLVAWRVDIAQIPQPKKGCFIATYPSKEWREVPCTSTPPYPQPPRRGPRPLIVGNGDDLAPQVPGFISTAIGSFDSLTNVTSESGPIGNTGPSIANAYTLQLNTNFFASTACAGSPNPNCNGWQQFVFENYGSGGRAYIQYWLIQYNATCPAGVGWNQFSFTGDTDIYCWKNNTGGAVPVPNQTITNLGQLSLSGNVGAGGDSVTLSVGGTAYTRAGDNAVNAAAGWQTAEFGVFGDGGNSSGGGMASFNAGAGVAVRTRVISGSTAPPGCVVQGYTAETNNLSFVSTAPAASPLGPALLFSINTAGVTPANCLYATAVGDTHLTTFNGLLYDFQASGDFLLAQRGPDFVVQARKVSGAPNWPDASINHAVATQMGKTQVAVCLGQGPLVIDGNATDLGDGEALSLADGVDVSRMSNVYYIVGQDGDSMRAEVKGSYIDVSVGLGVWPDEVRGLLANANGEVEQIAASDGKVLTSPFRFEEFYHHYADSWRVKPSESLLTVCGEVKEEGIPSRPFYADDLDPEIAERTRAACINAGVEEKAFLDACMIDVAVIDDERAAEVFVGAPAPVAVGEVT